MSRRNKLIWLLVGCWLGFVPVAHADFAGGKAAYDQGDYATALKEFEPLARQGDADAQEMLGAMYRRGQGVSQDGQKAHYWFRRAVQGFRKAAEQGDAHAQYNLGLMYYRGDGVLQDYVLAHMWFNIAASQGYEPAIKYGGIVAEKMTREQIAEAQKLAREWKPNN